MVAIPIGSIIMYAGEVDDTTRSQLFDRGWLPCDGKKYSTTEGRYQGLFRAIGRGYGGDDTGFCVPMCQGLFLRGRTSGDDGDFNHDPDRGVRRASRPELKYPGSSGNDVGSMQDHDLRSHRHPIFVYVDVKNEDVILGNNTLANNWPYPLGSGITKTSSVGSGVETRPANIYAHFIIKYAFDSAIPVGAVIPYAGPLPNINLANDGGWLWCDGSGFDHGAYPDLRQVISSFYGADDTKFYLPDYRGRFVRGVQGKAPDDVPAYDPDADLRTSPTQHRTPGNSGNRVGSCQNDAFASHAHDCDLQVGSQTTAATAIGYNCVSVDGGRTDVDTWPNPASEHEPGDASETRPDNVNVHYLINVDSGSALPIGGILAFAGPPPHFQTDSEPLFQAGFLLCNGRLWTSEPSFSALFNVIGISHGGSKEKNEFCVPQYQGMFLRGTGKDPDAHLRQAQFPVAQYYAGNSGDNVGSWQRCTVKSHTHTYTMYTGSHTCNYGSVWPPGVYAHPAHANAWTTLEKGPAGRDRETRPVNLLVTYLIRYK
jgi:microcystin-dependent protein